MKSRWHEWYMNTWIQTFMRSPYVDFDEINKYDITFVWIPYDAWCSYRKWCSLAPKYIREYSYRDKVNWDKYYDFDYEKLMISNNLRICDIWDIHVNPSEFQFTFDSIENTIKKIRKWSFPLIVGWDHSIAYATIKWCISWINIPKDKIAILHFDAHVDIEESYLDMPKVFHWNPFSSLINEKIINPENLYTVWLRWLIPSSYYDYIHDMWIHCFSVKKIRELWIEKFADDLISRLQVYDWIYISFDIDCLDPSEVKWTWTPMEWWLYSREILYFIKKLNICLLYTSDAADE